jgi:hypothetical protein
MTASRTQLIQSLVADIVTELTSNIMAQVSERVRQEFGMLARGPSPAPASSPADVPPLPEITPRRNRRGQQAVPADVPAMVSEAPPAEPARRPRRSRLEPFDIGASRKETVVNIFKANKERVFKADDIVKALPTSQLPSTLLWRERAIMSVLSHLHSKGCLHRVSRGKYKFRASLRRPR